ncbi:MAG TPA: alpha/beta hydrolase, partial [Clostridiales bacterium]|nr:alpha/beta hydrolase [Clostridiales bacterium]
NPIIILLHGGPGNNMAYYSYYWQTDLEKEYTIVHWDQRGCGNTYYRNKEAEKPTLDLLISDLDELVNYVCTEYSKENIVIMGHSWGSFLGKVYVSKHPEKVSAYVGVGQFTDIWKSEQCAVEEAVRLANAASKTNDVKKIEEQYQLVISSQETNMWEFMKLRQLTTKYLSNGENTSFSVSLFSPYLTFNDFKWFLSLIINFDKFIEIQDKLYNTLFSKNTFSENDYTKYEVPIIIIAGDCDWITPYSMAQDYFNSISAPKKEFILIKNAGHIPFKPGVFTKALLKALSCVQ